MSVMLNGDNVLSELIIDKIGGETGYRDAIGSCFQGVRGMSYMSEQGVLLFLFGEWMRLIHMILEVFA